MIKRHQPTPEEIADFHAAVADATPLKKPARVAHERPKPVPRPRQRELDEAAVITESLHGPFEIDDLLICTSRQFDAISGINTEYWLWADEHGERQSLYFKIHVYTATELTRMLRQAGLEPIAYHGQLASPPNDYPFDPFTSRLVVVAQKPK